VDHFLRILNIGNTHVQVFDSPRSGEFVRGECFPTADFDPQTQSRYLPDLIVASVVPALTGQFQQLGAFIVSGKMKLPFAPSGLDFSTVGADRLANAAALLDGPLPALSIDFGTAITFEYVTKERQFAGGAILPGRMLLRQALHGHTAQLPLLPLYDAVPPLPGQNTVDAMRIGTDGAAVGAVRSLIGQWKNVCEPEPLRIAACGGDRAFFLNHLEGVTDGGDWFTVSGIRRLWEFCHAG